VIATRMSAAQLADEGHRAVPGYRDQHGYDEPQARAAALIEVVEGIEAEAELPA
jgi:hypothetical protein